MRALSSKRWWARLCRSLLALAVFPLHGAYAGGGSSPTAGVDELSRMPAAYCGVMSLGHAMQVLGTNVSVEKLVKPQYISSRQGSSIADLVRAASDFGLHIKPISGMTCRMLRHLHWPVILHVKSRAGLAAYDHWLLFAGEEGSRARIYNGTNPLALMDFDSLAASWDGVGLIVSREPISLGSVYLDWAVQYLIYFAAGLWAVLLLRVFNRRLSRAALRGKAGATWCAARQALVLLLCAFVISWADAPLCGYLSDADAIAAIQEQRHASFLPHVRDSELLQLLQSPAVTLIDARSPEDFEAGHLPGAISIPFSLAKSEIKERLRGLSTSEQLLVYCHSNGCPYSEVVAREVSSFGFGSVSLFRDGWLGWLRIQAALPRK